MYQWLFFMNTWTVMHACAATKACNTVGSIGVPVHVISRDISISVCVLVVVKERL